MLQSPRSWGAGHPGHTRPGAPCPDAPLANDFLLDHLGHQFTLLALGAAPPEGTGLATLTPQITDALRTRYLGDAPKALYLIRPDQHIAARWPSATTDEVDQALARATGQTL